MHWGLLVLIAVVVVSGYLLPWSQGNALDLFGVGIPSPTDASPALHEFVERVHDVAGHLFIALLALHVTGAVKHAVLDRHGTAMRMIRPAVTLGVVGIVRQVELTHAEQLLQVGGVSWPCVAAGLWFAGGS